MSLVARGYGSHGVATRGYGVSRDPGGEIDYHLAWKRLQDEKKRLRRIHRDDEEMLELLTMFTGYYDS